MADQSGLMPPYLDPTQYPAYLDAQRKQQIAQMLQSSLQQSINSPSPQAASVGPYTVQAKRGALQNLAPILTAALAGKAQNSALQAQSDYLNPKPPYQPAPFDASASAQAPGAIAQPAPGPGSPTSAPAPSGLIPSPQQPQNPMIPSGMSRQQAQAMMNMLGPQEYAKNLMSQYMGTPEWQTALRANNGNSQAAMAQLQAEANAKGTLHARQGEDLQLPNGTWIRNPVLGPGEQLTRNAQGDPDSVSLIPGAAAAAGTLKGVQTAADVANTPRMVPMGGGSERLMYPGDPNGPGLPPALRQSGGAPSGANPPPGAGAQRSNGGQPSNQTAAANVAAIPQKDSNGIFSNNLPANIPKMQIPSTPGQTTNAYQQKVLESAAAKHQELVNKFDDQSASGAQQLEYLTAAEKALPAAEVGPMSEWLTHNRGMLIENFPSLAGALGGDKVTPTLELNKQLTNAALQGARTTFGTRMTQNEVNLQKDEMSPNPGMTRDALASLIGQAKMKAAYGVQQDKDYSDYHAAGGDPNRFESQYNVQRPLTRFSAQYATPSAALDRLKSNPALLPDFKTKYGWDPTR